MDETDRTKGEDGRLSHYEIRIQGHLDARWASWFEGLTLTSEEDGATRLSGPVVDQAALHGLLRKVRDLGLPLLSVLRVTSNPAHGPDDNTDTSPNTDTIPNRSHKETNP